VTSERAASVVIYDLRASISLLWGYPKSIISVEITCEDKKCRVVCGPNGQTVDELVDEHEIVLHRFLVELAKIGPRDGNKTIEKFEDEGSICIIPVTFVRFTVALKDGWGRTW
jgi:hypothetical protein